MKRLLTLLTIGIPMIASAAAPVMTKTTFSDVPPSAWYVGYVEQAVTLDIVAGYRDSNGRLTGKFGPGDNVTVAQALKMAVEASGYDVSKYTVGDQWHNVWYGPYVGVAQTERFSFFVNRLKDFDVAATRGEIAQIVTDAFRLTLQPNGELPFTDVPSSDAHAMAISKLYGDGVISGDTDAYGHATGTFRPGDRINRAEAVKLIMRARENYGTPAPSAPSVGSPSATVMVVTYGANGFTPSELHVSPGTEVRFENNSSLMLQVASNPHPVHTDHPEINADSSVVKGQSYSVIFRTLGTFGYHNHLHAGDTGTIIVE